MSLFEAFSLNWRGRLSLIVCILTKFSLDPWPIFFTHFTLSPYPTEEGEQHYAEFHLAKLGFIAGFSLVFIFLFFFFFK